MKQFLRNVLRGGPIRLDERVSAGVSLNGAGMTAAPREPLLPSGSSELSGSVLISLIQYVWRPQRCDRPTRDEELCG